ncbi:uncharacterized protein PGTG_06537 [Puccinia graminis f. sp. tritici CRL 75-36-700-3]|uniref:Uncharacterized protein n=1 Tax=Puccinia graminis f. sp. tritici (strain CRL 75-36-700-3 / race SCCL) TaxID=418459 RepID=E3K8B6_PUCGT|nr:uncharacterized protein PGTG_06537 [Puccinia graminis f. sp. tritici CRL 75-36-700-3]EFP80581.2 hypothetical protein PGTG_06537 [Puccinia graminis f. sp. tritici CRL 75-36-700-3]
MFLDQKDVFAADPQMLNSYSLASSWWDHEYDCEAPWIPAQKLLASFSTNHLPLSVSRDQLSECTRASLQRAKAKLPVGPFLVPAPTNSKFHNGSPVSHPVTVSTSFSTPTPSTPPHPDTLGLTASASYTPEAIRSHLLGPDEVNQNHPDTQLTIAMENFMNEMRQLIRNSDSEHNQGSTQETPVNQQFDILRIGSSEREEDQKSAVIQQLFSYWDDHGFWAESANLKNSLLKGYHQKFTDYAFSNEFSGKPTSEKFPTEANVAFVMVHRMNPSKNPGFVYKILGDRGRLVQSANSLVALDKHLLRTLHKLHEILLNALDASTFVHYSQQKKLFDWLDREIFTPTHGPPLIGIRNSLDVKWREQDKIGSAKSSLIRYFGQEKVEKQLLASTAYDLIEKFGAENEFDYSTATHPFHFDRSIRIHTTPHFEETMRALVEMTKEVTKKYILLFPVKSKANLPGDDKILRECIAASQIDCHLPDMANLYLSKHPKLPVIMYFQEDQPLSGHLRVAEQGHKQLRMSKFKLLFKKLLKAANILHAEILKLGTPEEVWDERRVELFQWLNALAVEAPNLLPIIGSVTIKNKRLAPWEDISYDGIELYTPAQVKILEYLSKSQSVQSLQEDSAYFLTAWYQEKYPNEYENLVSKIDQKLVRYHDHLH